MPPSIGQPASPQRLHGKNSIFQDQPEERDERNRRDEGEAEPGVEDVGQAGQDHERHREEQADHHSGKRPVAWSHDLER